VSRPARGTVRCQGRNHPIPNALPAAGSASGNRVVSVLTPYGSLRDGTLVRRSDLRPTGSTGSALAIAVLALACSRGPEPERASAGASIPADEAWFVEDARASGLEFTYRSGAAGRWLFPEIMGGGVGLLDFDGDGWLDVYLVQGGSLEPGAEPNPPNQLHRNRGDGGFHDVTQASGAGDRGYGMGCACGDYDGDGDVDLYVTNVGPNVLLRNQGDGTFRDVSAEAGVADPSWSASAAFFDPDADGDLDLFVVNYVRWSVAGELDCRGLDGERDYCQPNAYGAPAPDTFHRNDGHGRFREATVEAGFSAAYGNGLGVACSDFDGDGRIDVYVANDMMANQLWLQQPDGRFADRALERGCALSGTGFPESGMGVQAARIGREGAPQILVTHMRRQTHTWYAWRAGRFVDATAELGLALPSLPFTGFGLGIADFDADGRLDLYVADGRVLREAPFPDPGDPYAEEDQLFRGSPGGRFAEVLPRPGVKDARARTSRGAAYGDLDNDGDVDLVIIDRDAPCRLLRNRLGSASGWIAFRVLDRHGRDAIGARVRLDAAGSVQWREVAPAASYLSSHDPRVHFGLGSATGADSVEVRWPEGEVERFESLGAGRLHELRRGRGR